MKQEKYTDTQLTQSNHDYLLGLQKCVILQNWDRKSVCDLRNESFKQTKFQGVLLH